MSGSSTTISNSEPRLGALRVQTSMYGLAVRLMWGQPRVVGNLLWFGNFEAVAHTTVESQGGKGGGGVRQVTTTYTYYAAAMLALGRGPVAGIASAWKGKQRYSGGVQLGEIKTVAYTVSVTGAGGTFAVPLSGGTFKAMVSVATDDSDSYSGGIA